MTPLRQLVNPGRDVTTSYLEESRRALYRARPAARNAPAEPTTARMAVGFSGESSQPPSTPPPCARRGRATASRKAMPKSRSDGFFMGVSSIGKVLSLKSNVNAQKSPLDNTLVYGGDPNSSQPPHGKQRILHRFTARKGSGTKRGLLLNEITPGLYLDNTLLTKRALQIAHRFEDRPPLVI